MPANLPPQYLEAEKRFREAKTKEEKIEAIQEMIALLPKHKGTDHLFADLKRRLSKLKAEPIKKAAARQREFYNIKREGAGQVVIIGSPNCGKSSLLQKLTNAKPEIQDYPFTTRKPLAGMMEYEDIKIQLIDLPPLATGMTESWVYFVIRNSDCSLLCVDSSSQECLEEIENIISLLKENRIIVVKEEEKEMDFRLKKSPALLLCMKKDIQGSEENIEILKELYENKFKILSFSIFSEESIEKLKEEIFKLLNLVRVYSKIPGKPPDTKIPFVLKKGATIWDFSEKIHKDFQKMLQFARVWNKAGLEGLRVGKDYVLNDKDIVELHI